MNANISPDFLNVRMFHSKFFQPTDMPVFDGSKSEAPRLMNEAEFTFRRKFLFEEFDEYALGFNKGNLIKAADALFDLQYVTFGTALYMRAGVEYFNMGWPTFESVVNKACVLGVLNGAPQLPRLLTQAAHEVMHESLSSQLKMFSMVHQSAEPNACPFALVSLWNLSYSIYLTAALMGIPWKKCWDHVQEANMGKVRAQRDGSDSTRGTGMDVVKPMGWSAPDFLIAIELRESGATIPTEFFEEARKVSEPRETGPSSSQAL